MCSDRAGHRCNCAVTQRGDRRARIIGLEIAGYLAAHGARHLVLTSRRAPSDAVRHRIDALGERHGYELRFVAADVADAHDVARLSAALRPSYHRRRIVPSAGELGTTPVNLERRRN